MSQVPQEYSLLGLYGDRDFFKEKLGEGYTQVTFGSGDWVKSKRIVAVWVFYHPDGRIATYEHHKFDGGSTVRGVDKKKYNKKEFDELISEFNLKIDPPKGLKELLEKWS